MNKIYFLIAATLLSLSSIAQRPEVKVFSNVDYFYGVDYSVVNVKYEGKDDDEFIEAFKNINYLLLTEGHIYDVDKYLNLEIGETELDYTIENIDSLNVYQFRDVRKYTPDVTQSLDRYPKIEGTMLVIVAKVLDRDLGTGTYSAIIFNGQTKEILSEIKFKGEGKGRGIQKYWSTSLINGLINAQEIINNPDKKRRR